MQLPDDPDADDPARELRRVVGRLVTLGPERLERADGSGVTPADRVATWLQQLADLAADASSSPRRVVPRLRAHALSDQVVVLTREALAVARDDAAATADVTRRLVHLRRSL